jgi:plasmid maintenance system antidote protein VapI
MDGRINEVRIEILKKFQTQSDFAQAVPVHESLVSQVLRARRKLSPAQAKKWQRLLNCDSEILAPVTNGKIS